jgi:HSP20 family molecular chaperone IbpA
MHPTIELMEQHVRNIYRALTGAELREDELMEPAEADGQDQGQLSVDEVTRRFVELENRVRQTPTINERVPPFSFSPLLDVIDRDDHIVLELAAPGVDGENVEVECSGESITISGARGGEPGSGDHPYLYAEIPRGPFQRVVRIPFACVAEPRMEVEHGLIRIYLPKPEPQPEAEAQPQPQPDAMEADFEQNQDETTTSGSQLSVEQTGE